MAEDALGSYHPVSHIQYHPTEEGQPTAEGKGLSIK